MGDVIPFAPKHPQGYLIEAFGPDGHLSKASKGYEKRMMRAASPARCSM
jgi:hypothetical protein